MSLIFRLQKNNGGFFNNIWILSSNYLYAKKNNFEFYIDDREWTFTNNKGWRDYFISLTLINTNTNIKYPIHQQIDVEDIRLHQFSLNEYTNAFKDIFIFTPELNSRLEKQKIQFSLNNEYAAIFIRRGDKLYNESYYIDTEEYVKVLLDKKPKRILVQTDDYRAYEEVCIYLSKISENIDVITSCPNNKLGAFVFNYLPKQGSIKSKKNNDYLINLISITQRPVIELDAKDLKEHVEEMLIGVKLCLDSNFLATDFQSNVSRFIVCNHSTPLISVCPVDGDILPDFNSHIECPAKGFTLLTA